MGPRLQSADAQKRVVLLMVGLSSAYFVVHAALFYASLDFGTRDLGTSDLSDFFAFYSSARFLWDGGEAAALYDSATLKSFQVSLGADQAGLHPFNYPPHYLLVIWPLGGLPYATALILWQVATLGLFALALRVMGLKGLELLAVLVAPVTVVNFSAGQNGFLTSALLIAGLSLLARRQVAAGALFGLLTVKPHLGLLVPVACLAERRWIAIAAAGLFTAALFAVSLLAFGLAPWQAYGTFLERFSGAAADQGQGSFLAYSASVLMAEQLMGLPQGLSIGIQGVISLAVIVCVYRSYRGPAEADLRLALLLVGISLVAPFGFLYDLPFMAVAIVLVVRHGLRDGFLPYEAICLIAAWLVPFFGPTLADRGIAVTPWVHLAFFGFLLARLHLAGDRAPGQVERARGQPDGA